MEPRDHAPSGSRSFDQGGQHVPYQSVASAATPTISIAPRESTVKSLDVFVHWIEDDENWMVEIPSTEPRVFAYRYSTTLHKTGETLHPHKLANWKKSNKRFGTKRSDKGFFATDLRSLDTWFDMYIDDLKDKTVYVDEIEFDSKDVTPCSLNDDLFQVFIRGDVTVRRSFVVAKDHLEEIASWSE
jgi:hypothetical protein